MNRKKKFNRAGWVLDVLKFRIAGPDEEKSDVDAGGCKDISDRQSSIYVYVEDQLATSGQERRRGVAYLNQRQFVAHFVTTEGMTETQDARKWGEDEANPAVHSNFNEINEKCVCGRPPSVEG